MSTTVAGLRWYHWVVVVALAANAGAEVGSFAGAVGGGIMGYFIMRLVVGAWRKLPGRGLTEPS